MTLVASMVRAVAAQPFIARLRATADLTRELSAVGGYSPQPLTGADWDITEVSATHARAVAKALFSFSGHAEVAHGWTLEDRDGVVYLAVRFDQPFVPMRDGDGVTVTAQPGDGWMTMLLLVAFVMGVALVVACRYRHRRVRHLQSSGGVGLLLSFTSRSE